MARIPIQTGLFDEAASGPALVAARCDGCRSLHFPATATCPYCAGRECRSERVGSRGSISLYTVVSARPPGYLGELPYGFGVVDLPEGLRVVSRLVAEDLGRLESGAPARLEIGPVHRNEAGDEVVSWAYRPNSAAAAPAAPGAPATPGDGPGSSGHDLPLQRRGPASDGTGALAASRSGPDGRATEPVPPRSGPRPRPGRPVYVAGVGIHPFGRFADRTVTELAQDAVRAALDEAESRRGDLDGAFCGSVYSGVAAGHKVLSGLGLSGIGIVNVEAGCASGGAALALGFGQIASGERDVVLVFGMEKMPKGIIRSSFFPPWCEEAGLSPAPAYFALRARRLAIESGVTPELLARVSVKNHANGVDNPWAMYRKPVSVEQVLASTMVCDPLTLLMLCSPNEGAAAVVLSARPGPVGPPVRVLASALRSHRMGSVLGEHTPMSGLPGDSGPSPTEMAARDVYEAAGVDPRDLDLVELQDTDAGREILSIEELGLCPPGGGGAFVADGTGERDGRLPINPSGGLLSKGEPLGASALGQIVELVWQLRGAAERRQVARARLALGHTVGRGANASVVLLGREDATR